MNRRYANMLAISAALGLAGCAPSTSAAPARVVTTPAGEVVTTAPPALETVPAKPKMAAIGETVPDGNFAFTVTAVKCSLGTLTYRPSNLVARPQNGQFCVVVVKGTNITKQPQSMDWTLATVADTEGRSYSRVIGDANMAAWSTYVGDDVPPGMDTNPGAAGPAVYVFDVPAGVQLASVELHGGATTDGAFVAVS